MWNCPSMPVDAQGLFPQLVAGEGQWQQFPGPGQDKDGTFQAAEDQPDGPGRPLLELLQRLAADAAGGNGAVAGPVLIVIADGQGVDSDAGIQGCGYREQGSVRADPGWGRRVLLVGPGDDLPVDQPRGCAHHEMGIGSIG